MTFSTYPECKKFSASALKAMLYNSNNLNELRASGIVETSSRPFGGSICGMRAGVVHITHLVDSLHILLKDEENSLIRLVSHPIGTKTIIRLCRHLRKLQSKAFDVLGGFTKCWMDHENVNYDIIRRC